MEKILRFGRGSFLYCCDKGDCSCSMKEICRFSLCFPFMFFFILVLMLVFFLGVESGVESLPSTVELTTFSASRAMEDTVSFSELGEKCVYSSTNNDAVTWLEESIEAIMEGSSGWVEYEIEKQPFFSTHIVRDSMNEESSLPLYNVLLKVSSASLLSDDALMLSTHYDTICGSEGASSALMVGIQLELIRNMVNQDLPVHYPVIFVFTNGYETGSEGASAVLDHDWYKLETARFILLNGKTGSGRLVLDRSEPKSVAGEVTTSSSLYSFSLLEFFRSCLDLPDDEFEVYSYGTPNDPEEIGEIYFDVEPNQFWDAKTTTSSSEERRAVPSDVREGKAGISLGMRDWSYFYGTPKDTISEVVDEGDVQEAGYALTDIINVYLLEDTSSELHDNPSPDFDSMDYWYFNFIGAGSVAFPMWSVVLLLVNNSFFLFCLCCVKCTLLDVLIYNPFLSRMLKSKFKRRKTRRPKKKKEKEGIVNTEELGLYEYELYDKTDDEEEESKKLNKVTKLVTRILGYISKFILKFVGKKGLDHFILGGKRCVFMTSYSVTNILALVFGLGEAILLGFLASLYHEKSYNSTIILTPFFTISSAVVAGMLIPWYANHIVLKNCCFCIFHLPHTRSGFSEYRALRDEFQFEKYLSIYSLLSLFYFICVVGGLHVWCIMFFCYFMMFGFLLLMIIDCVYLVPFNCCVFDPKYDGHRYGVVSTVDEDEIEENKKIDEVNIKTEEEEEEEGGELVTEDQDDDDGSDTDSKEEEEEEESEVIDNRTKLLDADFGLAFTDKDDSQQKKEEKKEKKKKKKRKRRRKEGIRLSIRCILDFIYDRFFIKTIRERGIFCWSFLMTLFMFIPCLCALQTFYDILKFVAPELCRSTMKTMSIFTLCYICFFFFSLLMITVALPLLLSSSQSIGKVMCLFQALALLLHFILFFLPSYKVDHPGLIYTSTLILYTEQVNTNSTIEEYSSSFTTEWRSDEDVSLESLLSEFYIDNQDDHTYRLLEDEIKCDLLLSGIKLCKTEFEIDEEMDNRIPQIYSSDFNFLDTNSLSFNIEYFNETLVSIMRVYKKGDTSKNVIYNVTWDYDDDYNVTTENSFSPALVDSEEWYGYQYNKVNVETSKWSGILNIGDGVTKLYVDIWLEYDEWAYPSPSEENSVFFNEFFEENDRYVMAGSSPFWVGVYFEIENPFY